VDWWRRSLSSEDFMIRRERETHAANTKADPMLIPRRRRGEARKFQ
jgi:hypothetical protein